jgi:hypothetical protein
VTDSDVDDRRFRMFTLEAIAGAVVIARRVRGGCSASSFA